MSSSTTQPTITDLFYYEMLERNVPHQHIGSVFAALSAAKDKARKQEAGLAGPRPKGRVNGKVKGTPREMVKAGVKGRADGEANNMGDFRRVDGKILNRVLKDGGALKKKLLDFHRSVMTDASAKYHFLLTTPSGKVSVESSEDADREWRGQSPLICRRRVKTTDGKQPNSYQFSEAETYRSPCLTIANAAREEMTKLQPKEATS
jgi:hypothetical protein